MSDDHKACGRSEEVAAALRDLQAATYPPEKRYEDSWNRSRITLHTWHYWGPDGPAEPDPHQVSASERQDVMIELDRRATAFFHAAETQTETWQEIAARSQSQAAALLSIIMASGGDSLRTAARDHASAGRELLARVDIAELDAAIYRQGVADAARDLSNCGALGEIGYRRALQLLEPPHIPTATELQAAIDRLAAAYDALARCEDEFLPQDPGACAEYQQALNAAIEAVIAASSAAGRIDPARSA